MSMHLNPPFRAEHIGSLKRPAKLLEKRAQFDDGKCTAQELRAVEDEAIKAAVQMQRDCGIKSITDGEFRRHMFFDGVFDTIEGMTFVPVVPKHMFMMYVPDVAAFEEHNFKNAASYVCTGKLKRTKPFYVDMFNSLKVFCKPEEVKNIKMTMCAPEWYHLRHGPYAYDKSVYANDDEYFADIAVAYQQEIADLYAHGCRNIQIDDPLLAYFCAESMLKGMKEAGVDSDALLNTYIRTYNLCLKGKPADMTIGVHLCRGNFKDGRHFSEGGYDRIAIKLFHELHADCYYLEYDTERAGTFEPLKHIPANKSVVLGLISTKLRQLEDKQELKKKIMDAVDIIAEHGTPKRSKAEALNQICISPQCGFASHSEGNNVGDEDVPKKLKLVSDTAAMIWQ